MTTQRRIGAARLRKELRMIAGEMSWDRLAELTIDEITDAAFDLEEERRAEARNNDDD